MFLFFLVEREAVETMQQEVTNELMNDKCPTRERLRWISLRILGGLFPFSCCVMFI